MEIAVFFDAVWACLDFWIVFGPMFGEILSIELPPRHPGDVGLGDIRRAVAAVGGGVGGRDDGVGGRGGWHGGEHDGRLLCRPLRDLRDLRGQRRRAAEAVEAEEEVVRGRFREAVLDVVVRVEERG